MSKRTDLAMECAQQEGENIKTEKIEKITVTTVEIRDEEQEKFYSKPRGKYVTVEFNNLDDINEHKNIEEQLKKYIDVLLPKERESVLVVGLGNREITCDAIGPLTAQTILATRHIKKDFAEKIGLKGLKSVSVLVPDVLGKTGIEAVEKIKGTVDLIKPDAVIAIDALACLSTERLFKTVQLCNTGISPGSGVKNSRKEISQKTLGIPVIAIGVPTVVDALSLSKELTGKKPIFNTDLILTPKDADIFCKKISELISNAINVSLQPEIDPEIILSLV